LRHFGPQGWWPTTKPGALRPAYHGRPADALTEKEKFEICVGAILTQNTAWTNVEKALENLQRARALAPRTLCRMPVRRLAALIRPSGYYNQKAARLKQFSRYLCDNYSGRLAPLLSQPIGAAREELLSLNGIGPETADSMLLYAGGRQIFVVDAYTRRIGSRLGWFKDEGYEPVQSWFHARLPQETQLYNEYHALLVAVGKDFCRPAPRCGGCPLNEGCSYAG
jgi:endonuclease-3 related protein